MMIESIIARLFENTGLGKIDEPIISVPGGFMHRMYKVHAKDKYYAVKHLNPGIMARESAAGNFDRAESLEYCLEKAGIPIVPSLVLNGKKRQCIEGFFSMYLTGKKGK